MRSYQYLNLQINIVKDESEHETLIKDQTEEHNDPTNTSCNPHLLTKKKKKRFQ